VKENLKENDFDINKYNNNFGEINKIDKNNKFENESNNNL
jgi:hypothetical protein